MAEGNWDDICDVLVAGSGGGALIGAYAAGSRGLKTIVVEATDKFGGTTAYSGSGMWHPGNPVLKRSGAADDPVAARAYYKTVVGSRTPEALQDAYLDTGPKMIEELERNPHFKFEVYPWPDYYGNVANAHPEGRHIISQTIAASELGELRQHIRPTLSTEREGQQPADALMGGQALIGRALLANQATGNVELRRESPLEGLIVENGAVVGAEVETSGRRRRIRARRGVLLAAGGFEQNNALREKYGIAGPNKWSVGGLGNKGQALEAAIAIGAATDLMDQAWWCPGLVQPDGSAAFFLGLRGGLFVDARGERFANESLPYDRMGRELAADQARRVPCHFVFDSRERGHLPAINCVPGAKPQQYLDSGAWVRADTLESLAELIDVPAEALRASVERFNGFAKTGVDEDFGRGEDEYDRYFVGDNPALVPLEQPPYYAARVVLGDLGTKGGLVTDADARVLRADGSAIEGLYAAGNTSASVMRGFYPAPGSPIGTAIVFAHRAALHMAC
jgi:3-oxosteroid 1-dehydrogenase